MHIDVTQQARNTSLSQHYVIQARGGAAGPEGALPSLGTREEIVRRLNHFNTSSDGVDPDSLHGPGIRIDFPPSSTDHAEAAPVNQMLVTINEEEIGWLVLRRIAKEFQWTIVDTLSGREWNP